MAGYNNENLLRKIVEIQNIVLEKQRRGGVFAKHIYETAIASKYHISYATFNNYLARNAKRELAEIEARKALKVVAEMERQKVLI